MLVSIKDFLKEHGTGFLLHILGAVAIMLIGWWSGYPLIALVINTLLWPCREALQHGGKIFTAHRILEWVPAVTVGFIIYLTIGVIHA